MYLERRLHCIISTLWSKKLRVLGKFIICWSLPLYLLAQSDEPKIILSLSPLRLEHNLLVAVCFYINQWRKKENILVYFCIWIEFPWNSVSFLHIPNEDQLIMPSLERQIHFSIIAKRWKWTTKKTLTLTKFSKYISWKLSFLRRCSLKSSLRLDFHKTPNTSFFANNLAKSVQFGATLSINIST
jgi:hypothetical protein